MFTFFVVLSMKNPVDRPFLLYVAYCALASVHGIIKYVKNGCRHRMVIPSTTPGSNRNIITLLFFDIYFGRPGNGANDSNSVQFIISIASAAQIEYALHSESHKF